MKHTEKLTGGEWTFMVVVIAILVWVVVAHRQPAREVDTQEYIMPTELLTPQS